MPVLKLTGIKQDDLSSNDYIDELLSYIDSDCLSGQRNIVVGDGSVFSVGQMIIIYDGVDSFETAVIESISVNTLTMTADLDNSYPEGSVIGKFIGVLDTVNRKYLGLLSPDLGDGSDGVFESAGDTTWSSEKNFTSVLIKNGHTITVNGNFPIKCLGLFEIEAGGKLSSEGKGHAGGYCYGYNGQQGYSYAGNPTTSAQANYGGGGGGTSNPGGGGGGGYSTAGANATSSNYGYGGGTYNDGELSNFNEAYLKGSGGGGASRSSSGSNGNLKGGNGGGIIRLHCRSLIVAGEIDCDGENGRGDGSYEYDTVNYGGSGGGSGGTIFIQALNKCVMGSSLIHANGGAKGYGRNYNYNGGNGGKGRIRIECPGKIIGTSNPTYAKGYTSNVFHAKKGWYFTKEIKTLNPIITVNAYIKQEAVVKGDINSSALSGQADISLFDTSSFFAGDKVVVFEDEKMEIHEVGSITSNTITLIENLKYDYSDNAELIRIDVDCLISLVEVGDDEYLQDMVLQYADYLEDDIWYLVFTKTIKSINENESGVRLVGCTRLKGQDGDVPNVREINWNYF